MDGMGLFLCSVYAVLCLVAMLLTGFLLYVHSVAKRGTGPFLLDEDGGVTVTLPGRKRGRKPGRGTTDENRLPYGVHAAGWQEGYLARRGSATILNGKEF